MYSSIRPLCLLLLAAQCLSFPVDDTSSPLSLASFHRGFVYGGKGYTNLLDSPRIPVTPTGEGQGWLARWLSMGGEGDVEVSVGDDNYTIPHRPAAFPAHLTPPIALPISGFLKSFPSLPSPSITSSFSVASGSNPAQACIPPIFPPIRYSPPSEPYTIALIERGSCDFATKVRAAQERGAAGVIVGDGRVKEAESEDEGRARENLITMFSPEDTDEIHIPSVFVSRSSYLLLLDLLGNDTHSGKAGGKDVWVDLSEGSDEGGALSSLLSFALLMPSIFLLATIAIHRIRLARQREKDRAPPLVVLSLPERVWTPDIVWEKEDSDESVTPPPTPSIDAPPPISPADIPTPPAVPIPDPLAPVAGSSARQKERTKSTTAKKYFSKDECAICMDSFQRGEIVRILPCGHVFHKDECDEWLLKWRKLCPTCRADVTLPPGADVSGVTLTPVATAADPSAAAPLTPLVARLTTAFRTAREHVLGRGVRLDEEAVGETTPLVARSRAVSEVTARQTGGVV